MNDDKLIWVYADDYEIMTKEDLHMKIMDSYTKKVVCLETLLIYASNKEASKIVNLTPSAIQKCCLGQSKSCGKDDKNNPLHWMYYDEYIKNNDVSTLTPVGILSASFMYKNS